MKRRIYAVVIAITLLLNIIAPTVHAADFSPAAPGTILSYENYTLYSFENQAYKYNIFLDTNSGVGSFAIIYSKAPDSMQECSFSIDPESIDINSAQFWNGMVSNCLSDTASLNHVNTQTAITASISTQNELARGVSYDYLSAYESLLTEEYGPEREYHYRSTYVVGGVIFQQREDISYGVDKCNSYVINNAMTVAGVITSIIGAVASAGLLSLIGLVATVGGVITAGTRLDEYELYAYWNKYIVTQGGIVKYTSAQRHAFYCGYGSNKVPVPDDLSLDLLETDYIHVPNEDYFTDDYAQYAEAYVNYRSQLPW